MYCAIIVIVFISTFQMVSMKKQVLNDIVNSLDDYYTHDASIILFRVVT